MTIPEPAGPDPVALSHAFRMLLLDRSNERDQCLERILRAELRGYQHGRADGFAAGYEQAACDMEARWAEFAKPTARAVARGVGLMGRRWGPGGRAHYGDPRPGDYAGGPVTAW